MLADGGWVDVSDVESACMMSEHPDMLPGLVGVIGWQDADGLTVTEYTDASEYDLACEALVS
jgi:hypothetical protein